MPLQKDFNEIHNSAQQMTKKVLIQAISIMQTTCNRYACHAILSAFIVSSHAAQTHTHHHHIRSIPLIYSNYARCSKVDECPMNIVSNRQN